MPDKGNLPFKIPDDKVDSYLELKANNSDGYGTLVMNAAELWGANMEKEMAQGASLETAAASTEHQSVRWDFTGSMYGFITGVLSEFWEHGDEFRNWLEHRYDQSKVEDAVSDETEGYTQTVQT